MNFLPRTIARRLPALSTVLLTMATIMGCAHASWGDGGGASSAQRYYYFIKSNYQEMDREDQAALSNMAKASSLDKKSYYLKMETARLYARNGDNESALQYAQEAIDLNPGAPEPRLFAAWVAASGNKWELATSHYKEVLRLLPNNREALTYLGALYAETGRLDLAEDTFKKLVTTDPTYLSYYYLGSFYNKIGRINEAIKAFSESVKKNPDSAEALTELAFLYDRTEDVKAAEKTYRSLIAIRPEAVMPKVRLISLLLKTDRKAEAEKLLAEISEQGTGRNVGPVQFQLGLIYLDQGLYSDAAMAFETVLKSFPDDERSRYLLASTQLELGEMTKARENLAKIPKSSELYVDSRLLMTSTIESEDPKKKLKEALEIVSGALKAKPDELRLWVARVMLLDELGDLKQARRVILEAVKKFPDEAEVRFRLGVIEDKMGDKVATIAAMRQAIRLNPGHADALNYLAYTWAERQENLSEALALAEKADALKPGSGYIIDTLGWIHFHLGNTKKALDLLEQAVPLSSQDPVVLDHLGDVLLKLGREQEALNSYRQALDNDFSNQEKLQEELNEKINRLSK